MPETISINVTIMTLTEDPVAISNFKHICSLEFQARLRAGKEDVGGIPIVCGSMGHLTALGARPLALRTESLRIRSVKLVFGKTGHILPWSDKPADDGGMPLTAHVERAFLVKAKAKEQSAAVKFVDLKKTFCSVLWALAT